MPDGRPPGRAKSGRLPPPGAGDHPARVPSRTVKSVRVPRCPFLRYLFGIYSALVRSRNAAYVRALTIDSGFFRSPSRTQRQEPRAGRARPVRAREAGRGCRRNPFSAYSWGNRRRINVESIPNKYRTNPAGRAAGPPTGNGRSGPLGRISYHSSPDRVRPMPPATSARSARRRPRRGCWCSRAAPPA